MYYAIAAQVCRVLADIYQFYFYQIKYTIWVLTNLIVMLYMLYILIECMYFLSNKIYCISGRTVAKNMAFSINRYTLIYKTGI